MKRFLAFLLFLNFSIMPAFCIIEDEFAQKTLDKNLKIKTYNYEPVIDDFAQKNLNKNISAPKTISFDEKIPTVKNKQQYTKKVAILNEEDFIPVQIKIKENFSTKQNLEEGDFIEFETINEIKVKDKIYPKSTTVKARIETISANKFQGVPADLTIGNFSIDDNYFQGEINKIGANRSLWVCPMVMAGDMFFFVGELFNFIKGGHAKIKPQEIYTIYLKR